ncbi:MAG: putative inositol mono-phosphatase (suhB-like) [Gammaproteobacteria bacterium]|nr:putative inositol mono-phosphatase (suhB-like) [Gammaproteobacteria bacterium]
MADKTELQDMLTFARQTITAAGAIALQYFRVPLNVENKAGGGRFDPVTRADREIESYIRERISTTYPEHALVGEEAGMRTGRDNYRWFIDPIDGTKAYISGMPLWGILLGLMEADACRFGLMYQPYLQELYVGSEQGAYLCKGANTHAMTTRATRNLPDAILYCTHPAMFQSEQDLQLFDRVAERCKLMRYGGDCYAYCLLAHGFIDLVIEADLKSHDIVPLIPIIEAAGGKVTDWQGNSAINGGRVIAAANASLHEQALNLLQQPARS